MKWGERLPASTASCREVVQQGNPLDTWLVTRTAPRSPEQGVHVGLGERSQVQQQQRAGWDIQVELDTESGARPGTHLGRPGEVYRAGSHSQAVLGALKPSGAGQVQGTGQTTREGGRARPAQQVPGCLALVPVRAWQGCLMWGLFYCPQKHWEATSGARLLQDE